MAEKSTKVFSNKQEKMVAQELGGYQVGGSGAAPGVPGDVRTYEWLVECKTHMEPDHNIAFNASVWNKIKNEAMGMHRKPVLVVDDGSQKANKTWCLCNASNLNLSSYIAADLPMAVKKNITCSHSKLSESLSALSKQYVGEFYRSVVFELEWEGSSVCILPLETFKELFEA